MTPMIPIGPGVSIELQFSRMQGAALVLPEAAVREDYRHGSLEDIRQYAEANAESWYQYLIDQVGMNPYNLNGCLYVITGHDKTHCYENFLFNIVPKNPLLSLCYGSSTTHTPLSGGSNPQHTLRNLSVFVRGFKVMLRRDRWTRRKSTIKLVNMREGDPRDVMYRGTLPSSGTQSDGSSVGSRSSPSSTSPSLGTGRSDGYSSDLSLHAVSDTTSVTSWSSSDSEETVDSDSPLSERGSSILDSESESEDTETQLYHPSDVINRHILEKFPDILVAITHDDTWISALREADDRFPDDCTLISRVKEGLYNDLCKRGPYPYDSYATIESEGDWQEILSSLATPSSESPDHIRCLNCCTTAFPSWRNLGQNTGRFLCNDCLFERTQAKSRTRTDQLLHGKDPSPLEETSRHEKTWFMDVEDSSTGKDDQALISQNYNAQADPSFVITRSPSLERAKTRNIRADKDSDQLFEKVTSGLKRKREGPSSPRAYSIPGSKSAETGARGSINASLSRSDYFQLPPSQDYVEIPCIDEVEQYQCDAETLGDTLAHGSSSLLPTYPNGARGELYSFHRGRDHSTHALQMPVKCHFSPLLPHHSLHPDISGHTEHGFSGSVSPLPISYTENAAAKLSDRVRRRCFNCSTTDNSTWRRSTLYPGKVLCNKCGLFERIHSRPMPKPISPSHLAVEWHRPKVANTEVQRVLEDTVVPPLPGRAGHGFSESVSSLFIPYTENAAAKFSDRVRKRCFNCGTTDTPIWRRSNLNPGKVLCNKCGLFERTHSRPVSKPISSSRFTRTKVTNAEIRKAREDMVALLPSGSHGSMSQ